MSETINSGVRKSRKPHRCQYCADLIPAGRQVTWWSYSDMGSAGTAYAHPECNEMYQELREPWWGDEMPDWGEFRDDCRESFPDRSFPWDTP